MAGYTKSNSPYDAATNTSDKDDKTAPAIPEAVLAAFLTAPTDAITTAVATAVFAVGTVSTPRYSTAIYMFDTSRWTLPQGTEEDNGIRPQRRLSFGKKLPLSQQILISSPISSQTALLSSGLTPS